SRRKTTESLTYTLHDALPMYVRQLTVAEVHMHDGSGRRGVRGLELGECSGGPIRCVTGEVGVEISALRNTHGPERFEPSIDAFGRFAEVDVSGVAKAEHGIAQAVQPRGAFIHERGIEGHRTLRRVAFAPGRCVNKNVFRLGEHREIDVRHVVDTS